MNDAISTRGHQIVRTIVQRITAATGGYIFLIRALDEWKWNSIALHVGGHVREIRGDVIAEAGPFAASAGPAP